jgi:uncharacterized protein (DUF362 family)
MQLNSTRVSLKAHSSYEQPSLDAAIESLLASMDSLGTLRTARVLLKPNLITARNGRLACTDGRFIVAVARWFAVRGAQVAVGDSPSFGSARSVLEAIDALPVLREMGVPVVEFRQVKEVTLPGGYKVPMAAAAMECDLLVNLPKVKAHSQMRLTLAVKNLFGCVSGFHKPWWHMVHGGANGRFAELLVALLALLPAVCTMVDGIVAMHQTGPIHGEPYALGVITGGANPVAVDTGLMHLLGVDPRQCPLWCAAHRAGLAGTNMDELMFPLARPSGLAVNDFMVPEVLGPVRFNPFRFAKNSMKRVLLRGLGQ